MYEVGSKAIDKTGHVFSVESLIEKDFGNGPSSYYVMAPCFPYDFNDGYRMYVPVNNSANILRPIMNKEEALKLIDSFKFIEPYPDINARERRVFFNKIIASGNRMDICRVIKTLSNYRDNRKRMNKPFSDFDNRLLTTLKNMLDCELSLALNIQPQDVANFISQRVQ